MKKILIVFLFCYCINIYALEDIEVIGGRLSPLFQKDIYVYNYYTSMDEISIDVDGNISNYELNDGINEINISGYIINVFKNYKESDEIYLIDLNVKGYEINFNKDIFEYDLYIADEEILDINYKLSRDDVHVDVIGNGNFNKSHNVIKVVLYDEKETEYIINVYKSMNVSKIEKENIIKFSDTKKEIVKVLIITISSVVIALYYKYLF